MFLHTAKKRRGFTLIELAIVLGVVGVLSVGLWRLLATSNQQTKDQVTAQQQIALINAVKGYLADTTTYGGATWLVSGGLSTHTSYALPLPSSNASAAGCVAAYVAAYGATTPYQGLCAYLPTGFYSGTSSPYNQTYSIRLLTGSSSASQNYSFMIMASGTVVPDIDGARISNLIGGDGGFLYSSSVSACGAAPTACGAMGAWSVVPTTTYGFASAPAGAVVSRSFISAYADNSNYWLARIAMANDTISYSYNTMQTNLYMNTTLPTQPNIYMYPFGSTGGNSNALYLGNGSIQGNGSVGPQIDLAQGAAAATNLVTLSTNCSAVNGTACPIISGIPIYALSITQGDIGVGGAVTATKIFSASDLRLKKDIAPIRDPLQQLMKLNAVSYTFKNGGSKGMGVIAQELEKIYPQLVLQSGDTKYVDYNGLIGPLLGAVQELKRENDDLRAQLKTQAAREDRLEKKLDAKTP